MSFSFSVFGNRYFFTPKFTLITLILILVLLALSLWQWQAAANTGKTIDLINKRLLLGPIQADDLDKGGDWRFYPVELQGTFDDAHSILIINRMYKNQRGFQVLTPFRPANSSKEILVNRGWIAGDPERITDIGTTTDGITITGVLFQPLNYFMFGSEFDENNIRWPLQSKNINLEKFSKAINNPVYPYILLLSPSSRYGFAREWLWMANGIEATRHVAFAKQWLVLALTVLLMFLIMNIHRE